MFNYPPAWIRKGALMDLDFANGRYYGAYVTNGGSTNFIERIKSICTTGSNATANTLYTPDVNGLLTPNKQTASMRIIPGAGLWSEQNITNVCLWCRDLTNAVWVKTGCTAAKTQIGADGVANSASLLTAIAPAATCLQTTTSTSGSNVFSAYVKRSAGTGTISIVQDGVTLLDITSLINSTTFTKVEALVATITNPIDGFVITTSGDAIIVDFCQQEKVANTGFALYSTTRVLTTSATVSRLNGGATEEAFFYTDSSNYNAGISYINNFACKRPVGIVWTGSGNGVSGCLLTGTDLGGFFITGACDGTGINGATGQVGGLGNINKVAFSKDGSTTSVCINGNAIASTASAFSNVQATHGGIGNRGSGDISINGYCSRVTYFPFGLSDGQLLEYTR